MLWILRGTFCFPTYQNASYQLVWRTFHVSLIWILDHRVLFLFIFLLLIFSSGWVVKGYYSNHWINWRLEPLIHFKIPYFYSQLSGIGLIKRKGRCNFCCQVLGWKSPPYFGPISGLELRRYTGEHVYHCWLWALADSFLGVIILWYLEWEDIFNKFQMIVTGDSAVW